MKVATKSATSLVQGNVESVEMSLSKRGMLQAARMFRDQIYTHKAWAVVREIVANAIDEHNKHGITEPVQISLPNMNDPHFRVRDFANGLSKEMVFSVFFQYFESTKDTDNDGIGGFGIGAKSPLAYAEMFFVDSYHNGEKTSYVANINGEASTAHKMALQDTDETGIEVAVPVDSNDFDHFAKLVGELVHFSGWNVEIKGQSIEDLPTPDSEWQIENEHGKVGHIRSMFKSASGVYANIKGILYAVDSTEEIKSPFYNQVVLYFDGLDEIEISPSRERIELSKRNIIKINKTMEKLKDAAVQEVANQIKHVKTARERFAIKSCAAAFRSSNVFVDAGIGKVIPSKFFVTTKDATVLSWGDAEVERERFRSMFRYPNSSESLEPSGLGDTGNSYYYKSNIKKSGSIVIIPEDKPLRSEWIIAYAEKMGIEQPLYCVKNQDAPELWVEDSDYWRFDESKVTKDEAKEVRERYHAPRASGKKAASKVKGNEILAYSSASRCSYLSRNLDRIKQEVANGKKFVLISMDESDMVKSYAQSLLLQLTDKTPLFVFESRFPLWKRSEVEYEMFDMKKLEKVCAEYLKGKVEIKLKNGFCVSLANSATNKKKYIPSKQIDFSIEREIKRVFPNLKVQADKKYEPAWQAAQKRYDALSKFEKEVIEISEDWSTREKPAIRAEGKKLIDKIFV